MQIAIVGYGKMGRMIERVAITRSHSITARFDIDNNVDGRGLTRESLAGIDAAIEFSTPEVAPVNVRKLVELGVPVVVGTTGWYSRLEEMKQLVGERGGALVYSANYSVGMNLFFRLASEASRLFARYSEYDPFLVEAHHKFKKDAPSGTAAVIAGLMRASDGESTPAPVSLRA